MSIAPPYLYNSLTRRIERLAPAAPPLVQLYACGPTVYDDPHVGNFRYFVWVDVLHRFLAWKGYDVQLVMNVTDIDDKIIARAAEAATSIDALTEEFIESFRGGLKTLRIRPATDYPRATDYIPAMIDLIQKLLDRQHAYAVDGNVFFRVASFPRYGELARLQPDDMQATARVADDEFGKEDPRDFALWKAARTGEPEWPAPFGAGRPGWHLECSAMSMAIFGPTFDMHVGGADLMFPHHENEIAQSEASTGIPFVRHWMHCQHLVIDGAKMSKSEGNFRTLAQLTAEGHDPVALRYLLASVHYRRQLNLTAAALEQAHASVQRLRDVAQRVDIALAEATRGDDEFPLAASLRGAQEGFAAALDDDLNTAGALGHLFVFVRELNSALDEELTAPVPAQLLGQIKDWFESIDEILCVFGSEQVSRTRLHGDEILEVSGPPITPALQELVLDRVVARRERDFARADALRDELAAAGLEIEDGPTGARWKILAGRR
jgi:cysteinyl-tRNA synthetase